MSKVYKCFCARVGKTVVSHIALLNWKVCLLLVVLFFSRSFCYCKCYAVFCRCQSVFMYTRCRLLNIIVKTPTKATENRSFRIHFFGVGHLYCAFVLFLSFTKSGWANSKIKLHRFEYKWSNFSLLEAVRCLLMATFWPIVIRFTANRKTIEKWMRMRNSKC